MIRRKVHQYQLVVQYEEERGAQYGVELWGTIDSMRRFSCVVLVWQNRSRWVICETSTNTVSGPGAIFGCFAEIRNPPPLLFSGCHAETHDQGCKLTTRCALTQAVTEFVLVVYPTIDDAENR